MAKGAIVLVGYNPEADICLWGYGGRYIGKAVYKFPHPAPAIVFKETDPGRTFGRGTVARIFREVKPCREMDN